MGIEVLDSASDLNNVILENALEAEDSEMASGSSKPAAQIDARRRLEEKMEEMRLLKEVQEFDFDY